MMCNVKSPIPECFDPGSIAQKKHEEKKRTGQTEKTATAERQGENNIKTKTETEN